MEPNSMHVDQPVEEEEEGQEEYVLLDLGSVSDIPPNAPYVLSGLDTLSPVLMIGDRLKLVSLALKIGHYEETIGTCIIFSENGSLVTPIHQIIEFDFTILKVEHLVVSYTTNRMLFFSCVLDVSPEGHMEMGPSKPNKVHRKEVTPVASLTKTLKFRLSPDINIQDETMTL
ncbi:hypothetical protein CDL15_Pgr016216 [Punica granatum]|uniref:Transcription factor TFIIIC triple barrel domain-containing protein n=1 Tax=Punica granatum TaxID=22663 RepID=A0A218X2C1_PUNGR|nr:hypothetical protein CDL15_Pgr016216 [Punica granatum]